MRKMLSAALALLLLLHQERASAQEEITSSAFEAGQQIAYLTRKKEYARALTLYGKEKEAHGAHDFEILERVATLILEEGAYSEEREEQLVALFGLKIAGVSASVEIFHILECAIQANSEQTQLFGLHFLTGLQDDRADRLLAKALLSNFLSVRLEAAHQLCMRKAPSSLGQVEALMYKLPKAFRVYFPPFFLQLNSSGSLSWIRQFLNDRDPNVRIATILYAAMQGRDDLTPLIRNKLNTQTTPAEEEAILSALGYLQDSQSRGSLEKCIDSPSSAIALAALRSLYLLGDSSAKEKMVALARAKNLFAISMLADIPETREPLLELIHESDLQVRYNAALSLLRHKQPQAVEPLLEILVRDTRGLGMRPQFSSGGSLGIVKFIPSAAEHSSSREFDLQAISLHMREQILQECLELPEESFLHIAEQLLQRGETELTPLTIALLEKLNTPDAIKLLKKKSQQASSPLVRNYCLLTLFRMQEEGPYAEKLYHFLSTKKGDSLIRFRPSPSRVKGLKNNPYELTPEENSRLLIESYAALAERHDERGIDAILFALQEGSPKNRPLLAGLLLRAIQ